MPVGLLAGATVFAALHRRRPRRRAGSRTLVPRLARHGFLGLWAFNEEVVWRRLLMGELLVLGTLVALGVGTVVFALVHRVRLLHVVTGATFGALYLSTGVIAASIAAHWTYNALVSSSLDDSRAAAAAPP
jgi:hypothetical protein